MSKIALTPNASGTGVFTIASPATNTNRTLTLPDEAGTIITTAGVPSSAMPAGSVLQVVQATKTDAAAIATTDVWIAIPAQGGSGTFSASITPSSATSKILVIVDLHGAASVGQVTRAQLRRDGTAIYVGDADGSRPLGFGQLYPNGGNCELGSLSAKFLDSPATTSAVTYSLFIGADNNSGTSYVNRTERAQATGYTDTRSASSIILMEIAA